jgi:tetratricopeptide (TPR) repeat protein
VKNIFHHLYRDLINTVGMLVGVLAFLGMIRLFVIPPSREQKSFLIYPLLYYLSMCAVFHLPRLSLPIVPAYHVMGLSFLLGSGEQERSRLGRWLADKFSGHLLWLEQPVGSKSKEPEGPGRTARRSASRRAKSRSADSADQPLTAVRSKPSRRRAIIILVMIGIVIWETGVIANAERFYRSQQPHYILAVARFLKTAKDPGSAPVILARKAHIAYYSGMRYKSYPNNLGNLGKFINYALDHEARYIIYSDIERMYFKADGLMKQLPVIEGIDLIYRDAHAMVFSLADWMDGGRVTGDMGNEDFTRLMKEAGSSGDAERILYTSKNIADLHIASGDWDTAAGYFLQGMELIRDFPEDEMNNTILARFRNYLSHVYWQLGRYREGIQLQQENIALFTKRDDSNALAMSHFLISRHFGNLGEIDNARRQLEISRDLYREMGNRMMFERITQALKQLENNRE